MCVITLSRVLTTGDNCEHHVCDNPTTCLNGGTCVRDGDSLCDCVVGYTGVYCETYMCDIVCENNATCDIPTGVCMCLDG